MERTAQEIIRSYERKQAQQQESIANQLARQSAKRYEGSAASIQILNKHYRK